MQGSCKDCRRYPNRQAVHKLFSAYTVFQRLWGVVPRSTPTCVSLTGYTSMLRHVLEGVSARSTGLLGYQSTMAPSFKLNVLPVAGHSMA